jgi:branched-chain amino acid transport system permease protein
MGGPALFIVSSLTLGAVYALLSLALNFECGVDGLWDLGIVSFFGIGAYTYAIFTIGAPEKMQVYKFGLHLPIIVGVVAAGCMGVVLAYLIGSVSLKLKNEYFLIVTFAFAEVIRQILVNEKWLTNGTAGLYRLAQPFKQYFGPGTYPYILLGLMLVVIAIVFFFMRRLTGGPFGRSLSALRENEQAAVTAGIGPHRYHKKSYMFAGFVAAVAGAFSIWYATLATPGQFTSNVTFVAWTAIVIGGIGNNSGAVLGAFLLILVQDLLRLVPASATLAIALSSVRLALVGAILIAVLRWRPRGILPERRRHYPRLRDGSAAAAQGPGTAVTSALEGGVDK